MLKGCAGSAVATVALPLLDAMLDGNGEALADGTPLPRRFVAFHFGNGVILPEWTPAATGFDWTPTPLLAPLAPVKAHCSVLSGMSIDVDAFFPHHTGMSGVWAGNVPVVAGASSSFGGASADQIAADHLGGQTYLKSLELAVSKRVKVDEGPTLAFLSHRGPLQPMPPIYSPAAAWLRMFWHPEHAPLAARRSDALGAVASDARRLKDKLGAADRARLDAHLESVAQLQSEILAPLPPNPSAGQGMAQPAETNADVAGVEPMPAVADHMIALLAHAFRCDVVRAASVMLSGPSGSTVYSHLGHDEENHAMTHAPVEHGAAIHEAVVWNVQQFSNLVQALAAIPEGTGSVLDRTVAVMSSDCAEGWTHALEDLPLVIAGGGGGLLLPGQHLRMPGRPVSDGILTALRAVAPEIASFGHGPFASTTPVSDLLP